MLGKMLRKSRLEINLTQKEFASMFKMSDARYNQYETGKRNPDYETLKLFADFFDVSIDYLFGRTNVKALNKSNNETLTKVSSIKENVNDLPKEALDQIDEYIELIKMKYNKDK